MNKFEYKNLTPFKWFVLENFPFIEADFDALTEWQLFCKLGKEMNKIINSENTLGTQMENVTNAFIELQNYVNNYFDNLDVQEEINNKLNELAESGKLENYLKFTQTAEYIFPKNFGNIGSGDISIIKYSNKYIMFDTHGHGAQQEVQNFLERNNISHIDYLIISHYDGDHCGNFIWLVTNNYIDKNTLLILPTYDAVFGETSQNYYNSIMGKVNELNLNYTNPTEKEVIKIDDNFTLQFWNTDVSYWIDPSHYVVYYGINYNTASLITLVKHGSISSLFTGDANYNSFNYIKSLGFKFEKLNLLKVPHHGFDMRIYATDQPIFPQNYYEYAKPDYSIILSSMQDNATALQTISSSYLINVGSEIYNQCFNNDDIKLMSNISSLNMIKGVPKSPGNNNYSIQNIYVDSVNYNTAKQDGSQTYPYKDLNQAIGNMDNNKCLKTTIHLANGNYNISSNDLNKDIGVLMNTENKLTIIGENNSIIEVGLNILNCKNITLNNLTIYTNKATAINIENSNVTIIDCTITSSTSSITGSTGISATNSQLMLIRNTITRCNIGLAISRNTNCKVNTITINNCNTGISAGSSNLYLFNETINNNTNNYNIDDASNITTGWKQITLDDKFQNSISTPLIRRDGKVVIISGGFKSSVTGFQKLNENNPVENIFRPKDNNSAFGTGTIGDSGAKDFCKQVMQPDGIIRAYPIPDNYDTSTQPSILLDIKYMV